MKISNSFRIPIPPDQAWEVLNDVPRVARCAPGAQLLEQREDGAYVGTVAVRLGPVALSFMGTFAYKEKDAAAHRVVAEAAGNEAKARGTARAQVVFGLFPDAAGTRVDVETDLQLAGSIAQYGRGAALIQSTAQVLINQFAANLAKEFAATGAPAPSAVGAAPSAAAAPAPQPTLEAATVPMEATEVGQPQRPAAQTPAAPAPAAQTYVPPPAAKPISLTSVLWTALLSWLRGLFGRKPG
jgi:carbon monoxide dehydrogenase subunit G